MSDENVELQPIVTIAIASNNAPYIPVPWKRNKDWNLEVMTKLLEMAIVDGRVYSQIKGINITDVWTDFLKEV